MRPNKVLTMLLAGGVGERLYPLTAQRSKPAVHFGGNFRIIDFTLMNCVLSGLRQIHLLTQYHSFSLSQHRSRRWSILSSGLGESIELVPPKMRTQSGFYHGTADAVYRNLDLLDKHRPDMVLILSGDHVYRADYERLIRAHVDNDADATVLTGSVPVDEASSFGVVRLGQRGRILDFVEKPEQPAPYAIDGECPINLGVYCFQTDFLIERLVKDSKENSAHDFGKNILPGSLSLGAILSCPLAAASTDDTPYWRDVGTIDSYFEAHMDLLGSPAKFGLRDRRWPEESCFQDWMPALQSVRTRIDDQPVHGKNLISSGVVLEDARVVDCVLSPGTRIGEGSELQESILFPGAEIGPGCHLKRVIVEEGVSIPAGTRIDAAFDAHDFVVSDGGVVVVSEGYRFVKPPIEICTDSVARNDLLDAIGAELAEERPTHDSPDSVVPRSRTRSKAAMRKSVTRKARATAARTTRTTSTSVEKSSTAKESARA